MQQAPLPLISILVHEDHAPMTPIGLLKTILLFPAVGDEHFEEADRQFDVLYSRLIEEIQESMRQLPPQVVPLTLGEQIEVTAQAQ